MQSPARRRMLVWWMVSRVGRCQGQQGRPADRLAGWSACEAADSVHDQEEAVVEPVTLAGDEDESQPIPAAMRYEHGKVVPHLTVEERVARGRAARREVPRSS